MLGNRFPDKISNQSSPGRIRIYQTCSNVPSSVKSWIHMTGITHSPSLPIDGWRAWVTPPEQYRPESEALAIEDPPTAPHGARTGRGLSEAERRVRDRAKCLVPSREELSPRYRESSPAGFSLTRTRPMICFDTDAPDLPGQSGRVRHLGSQLSGA